MSDEVSRVLRTRVIRRAIQNGVPIAMAMRGIRAEPSGQPKDSMSM